MSIFSIFDITGSAMSAQSKRINVSASNIANADSIAGPDGEAYRARSVVFHVKPQAGQQTGGVEVTEVLEDSTPDRLHYEPDHPLADDAGYVHMPNVNVVHEMVNSIAASRSYQANVEVMNSAKSLLLKTLTIGQ
ncbi:flagellar basal body rod protein FlgC [Pantoea dispersa]|uniref:flagellar basal body rod protein FlgC n=1 Tax=Pantoea dispersa TaxID=59814 RepID=UPI001CA78E54|nr:flagellar basal body rod protein FlgC [Pantoea dispersa]QZY96418.1 flagellar basal body rod protein FlgC [Pantoea dispersa]